MLISLSFNLSSIFCHVFFLNTILFWSPFAWNLPVTDYDIKFLDKYLSEARWRPCISIKLTSTLSSLRTLCSRHSMKYVNLSNNMFSLNSKSLLILFLSLEFHLQTHPSIKSFASFIFFQVSHFLFKTLLTPPPSSSRSIALSFMVFNFIV